jgi:hypothetical protein
MFQYYYFSQQRPGAYERASSGQPHLRHLVRAEGGEATYRRTQVQRRKRTRVPLQMYHRRCSKGQFGKSKLKVISHCKLICLLKL